MRRVIVCGCAGQNGRIVILNNDVKTAHEIASGSCIHWDMLFAQKTMKRVPGRGRAALVWITAAFLATTWASETQGFPEAQRAQADALANTQHAVTARNVDFDGKVGDHDFEAVQARRFGNKSVSVAQATTGDTEELQEALQQEHRRAELLSRELTIARHLEMMLTLHKARAESARFNQVAESEYAELRKSLQRERDRLKQASESGATELCKSFKGDRTDRLEQDLAAPKRDVETQTGLAAKANDDASHLKQAAESVSTELKKSLQQERERAERLEKDLAGARRDVETQTALATKANADATQLRHAAQSNAAELKKSLQQERERAERLEKDLAAARRDVETQAALATKANEGATQLKQAAESDAAELKKSLQQERERTEQLEKDLAGARRDVETQTAFVAKANEDRTQLKPAAERDAADLKKSLQQERERAERLEKDLAAARRDVETQTALAIKANDDTTQLKQAGESGAVELRKSLRQEGERAARLERDLAEARRNAETQTALAAKANEDASQLKQVAERRSAELKRSFQKEHDRAEALAQDLSLVHAAVYAYEAQSRNAGDQAAGLKQREERSAAELRKSQVQEWERAARLQQELAAARREIETQTALAAKAGTEAARLKQVADDSSAEFQRSLQQERDRAARLERELVSERKSKAAPAISAVVTTGQITQDKQIRLDASKPVAAEPETVAKARGDAQSNPEDAAEAARLVARASVLLGQGDIGSARIVLERAAETGSAQASFTLAETYDPLILPKWGTYGTRGDAMKARDLYAKAQAGGIKEARERLDALRR